MLNSFRWVSRPITIIIVTLLVIGIVLSTNFSTNLTTSSQTQTDLAASAAIAPDSQLQISQPQMPPNAIADVVTDWYPPLIGELYVDSPYYEAVQSLVEHYGIDVSLPDGTIRPDQPLTRGDFMLYLNQALDRIVELMEVNATATPAEH